ncbi:hypothetical protein BDZ97DRAFT_357493 [Flammula alnicola]|nr:hypothetical protein BDZ97DRAFT_357493 [Flammula alnicola]
MKGPSSVHSFSDVPILSQAGIDDIQRAAEYFNWERHNCLFGISLDVPVLLRDSLLLARRACSKARIHSLPVLRSLMEWDGRSLLLSLFVVHTLLLGTFGAPRDTYHLPARTGSSGARSSVTYSELWCHFCIGYPLYAWISTLCMDVVVRICGRIYVYTIPSNCPHPVD